MKTATKQFLIYLLFQGLLTTCPTFGQVGETKKVTEAEYKTWTRIGAQSLSHNGKWLSYMVNNEAGADTLFLKNTENGKLFSFVNAQAGVFGTRKTFIFHSSSDSIAVLDLEKGTLQKKQATDFELLYKEYLMLVTQKENGSTITIEDAKGKQVLRVEAVQTFKTSPNGKSVVYGLQNEVRLLNIGTQTITQTIQKKEQYTLNTITWGKNPENIILTGTEASRGQVITLYNSNTKQTHSFVPQQQLPGSDSLTVKIVNSNSIINSDDAKRLFIPVRRKNTSSKADEPDIKVWNSRDKQLKSYTAINGTLGGRGFWVWEPEKNTGKLVGWEEEGIYCLNGNQNYVISYDSKPYKPALKYSADRDYYVTNLADGKKALFLKKQPAEHTTLAMSPDGNYAFYFREKNWWCYNFKSETHHNLTENTATSFMEEYNDKPQLAYPYGIAGWDTNKGILLYDKFDIWRVDLDKKTGSRLTEGREKKRVYRISKAAEETAVRSSSFVKTIPIINWNTKILLETKSIDKSTAGLVLFENGKESKELYSTEAKLSNIIKAKEAGCIVFTRERFDTPPEIMFGKINQNVFTSIFKSNRQIAKYNWGKSEVLTFKDPSVGNGSAVLFYPANYNPQKKYPMIVHIYEDQEDSLHEFVNPSLYNENGYNVTHFTQQGYFVLHPTITYVMGEPGKSALNAVLSATDQALVNPAIDADKIGIIGHSFGGYQTLFIITQTDRFAAAVAGAGIFDLTSSYFSLGKNYLKPETWRYEYFQMRMGVPYYENKTAYDENAPIRFADSIHTPLLSWTGEKDGQVDPAQSMELYMALRRLGKEHLMVLYPDENHTLRKPFHQKDLTLRLTAWFNHKLKGEPSEDWMQTK